MSEQSTGNTINMPRKVVMPRKIKIKTNVKANTAGASAGVGAGVGAGLGDLIFGGIVQAVANSVFGLDIDRESATAVAQSIMGVVGAVSGGWLGAFLPRIKPKDTEVELDDGDGVGVPVT